jgi:hypothetical protein
MVWIRLPSRLQMAMPPPLRTTISRAMFASLPAYRPASRAAAMGFLQWGVFAKGAAMLRNKPRAAR